MVEQRVLVIWCPDWPAIAAARQARQPSTAPVVVFTANRVRACTPAARAEGVRLGQRRRDAQSHCPTLVVTAEDPDRDARLFEPVVQAVEAVVPGVEVLRPGLLACAVRGPRRYFGSEEAAAEKIVDVVEALDVECRVGVADSLAVAVLAARRSRIVPDGQAAAFCAPLPITELSAEPAISGPERAALTDLLIRLGLTSCGSFAALPEGKVATRFGADAVIAHHLARGRSHRGVSRRAIPADLTVEQSCDPPLERVDTAAFAARALAERFHEGLAGAGLACTRLTIRATLSGGQQMHRTWRCAQPLTPAATADRVRWQLDGWLTGRRAASGDQDGGDDGFSTGGIVGLVLEPVEAIDAGRVQFGLWGSDGKDDQRAGWAFARVQGLLGPESVLTPVRSGGRGPVDRIAWVPWGDERVPPRPVDRPWPGALPAPSPTRLARSGPDGATEAVVLLDDRNRPVELGERGLLTATPRWIERSGRRHQVQAWAGPWLLDERWWAPDRRAHRARLQLLYASGPALVLLADAPTGWSIEGIYD